MLVERAANRHGCRGVQIAETIQMTIGHPQNPYQKWFSGHHRAEDSKQLASFRVPLI